MTTSAKKSFSDLGLSPELVQVTEELGFVEPSPIQAMSIPLLLQGKDLIGQAQTGSGKTAAFGLPVLNRIRLQERRIQTLVLCPTRELCTQVARELRKLGRRFPGLQILILSGGTPMGPQYSALERGVHIVVGTPGRVLDHLSRRSLDLRQVSMLVLDEADRMLEMGFQDDLAAIVADIPERRQTVLFSATFPNSIESMSSQYQRSPERVTVEVENKIASTIRQIVYRVEDDDRFKTLLWVLEREKPESAIVFCNFKASVAALAQDLSQAGISVGELHGDLEQRDRDRIMAKFRNRSIRVLIATDVAARGIDVSDLDLVVNFEMPKQPEIYVHRVGRTGRAGKGGVAISFCSDRESIKITRIEELSQTSLTIEQTPEIAEVELDEVPGRAPVVAAAMQTIYISGGRKDKVRPGDILGALTGEAGGLQATQVGKIEIHDLFSYVAVSTDVFEVALQSLRDGRIKGRKFRVEPVR